MLYTVVRLGSTMNFLLFGRVELHRLDVGVRHAAERRGVVAGSLVTLATNEIVERPGRPVVVDLQVVVRSGRR